MQHGEIKANDAKPLTSDASVGHGLGELNWEQLPSRPNSSTPPERILQDDVRPSSCSRAPVPHIFDDCSLSDCVSLDDAPPRPSVVEAPPTGTAEKSSAVSAALAPDTDLNNVCYSSTAEVREASEQLAISDSPKADKDSKFPLSTHEMDPSTNRSPRAYDHHDRNDASGSDGVDVLRGSASVDRLESGYESVDGSSVSEIEGENIIERLKRQVEHDQRCMSSLRKELEEERNAAAIAANEAMAMITRLQEEKAALHMEALQYLRMMEEQAEYDMEAIEKANDLVTEKEKEIQDLELELEIRRNNFPDESKVENSHGETGKWGNMENTEITEAEDNVKSYSDLISIKVFETNDKSIQVKNPLSDLEDEKLYISECLKNLERKLRQVSSRHASVDMSIGLYCERTRSENCEDAHTDRETHLDHTKEVNSLSRHKDSSTSNGSPYARDQSVDSVEEEYDAREENNHVDTEWKMSSIHSGEVDLATLKNEISDLNDRLEALEADHNFLEHACYSLQNGSEGLQFIQEIAHQLQELWKIESKRKCMSDP